MKLKTHKGARKRVKLTKDGKGKDFKVFKGAVNNSHLKRKQTGNSVHRKKKLSLMSKGFIKKIRLLINR